MAYHPPDGIRRDPDDEFKLNEAFALIFQGKTGELALKYLRSITIEFVGGPNISDAELRHMEGQRYLVALIEQRIEHGKHRQPGESDDRPKRSPLRFTGREAGGSAG